MSDARAAPQAPKPVLIDCDTGVDDAQALLLAFACPHQVDVRAVTCVAGNGPIDTVVDATLRVLDAAGAPAGLAVGRGFGRPLVEQTHFAPFIHGDDCLGDLEPKQPPSGRAPASAHATQLILDTLRACSDDETLTVVALAPLTNIAVALRLDPELCRNKIDRIVWMGGAVKSGGNYKAWAEANAAYDPEATQIVLSFGIPITMYPWDAFMEVEFTRDELRAMGFVAEALEGPNAAGLAFDGPELSARLYLREMRVWTKPTAVLGDAGALAALLDPEAVTLRPCHVTCELTGAHTRGMTVCDLRHFVDPPDLPKQSPNVDVVVAVDAPRIKRLFAVAVFGEGRARLGLPPAN